MLTNAQLGWMFYLVKEGEFQLSFWRSYDLVNSYKVESISLFKFR